MNRVFHIISVTWLLGLMSLPSFAQDVNPPGGHRFTCSVQVLRQSLGQFEVVREWPMTETMIPRLGEDINSAVPVEAFPALTRNLERFFGRGVTLLIKAYWINQGGEKIPELNVGLYVLNLTAPGRRALEVGAVGHAAEGYVGFLGSVPTSSGTYIRFGCKAADDTLKVRSVANSN